MASLRNPNTWPPYINTKDCSQGFCSLHCPQWCYIIYPPPPPSEFVDEGSGSMFSPLVIAIIGVLGSAFLLVGYYVIATKYCKKKRLRSWDHQVEDMEVIEPVPAFQESWHFTANNGLDEALIKLITVCQYKRGDGLVEGAECSVCLSEFEEGDSLRLLPKCSHAFHIPCIDMWLKSHSNCPLCRANIICVTMAIAQSQQPAVEADHNPAQNHSARQSLPQDEIAAVTENSQGTSDEEKITVVATGSDAAVKGLLSPESHTISGITVRRSISMDYFSFSTADALRMKRSFSSGIFLANKPQKFFQVQSTRVASTQEIFTLRN